ncbi:unnamed protein product [Mytilus edulis]|uniref:Uncharacterized protein n=1 Tax=Mytilus edulis TaxID=6550 RepID=A0A8S3SNQ9_MYTED|nr:unnamed protein product [Mytilus edulis]
MGPKRQGRKRQAPYDPELLENWTNATPNVNNNNNDRTAVLVDLVSKLSSDVQNLQQNVISLNNKVTVLTNNLPQNNNISTSPIVPSTCSTSPVVNDSVDGSQPIQNTITSVPITSPSSTGNYSIESAMQSFQTSSFNRHVPTAAAGSEAQAREVDTRGYKRTCYGYSAESLPLVETISPQLRNNITAGRDVNLASLLIPFTLACAAITLNSFRITIKPDPRLNRSLSIGEFIQAFSIYKNVMCSAYPQRRNELDLYERDIVDMATRYGGLRCLPDFSIECKNLLSAMSQPESVNSLIDTEIQKGYLCGPFHNIPYEHFRINPQE